jgi:hypothetical protein
MAGHSLFGVESPALSSYTDEMWQLVADELDQLHTGRCESCQPRKFDYLILENQAGGDVAIKTECNENTTVGSLLRGAELPHPVNFADAEICVCRPHHLLSDGDANAADQEVLPVRWDETTGAPTGCTNHALLPNDRLCVKLAESATSTRSAVATSYAPEHAMTRCASGQCPQQAGASEDGVAQIQYSIQIIEDCRGCMSEYEALRQGAPMMFAESKTLLPAIRVMPKNKLVRQVSSPKLTCPVGQTAQLEVGSETPVEEGTAKWEGLRLEVGSERFDDGLKVGLVMHAAEDEQKCEVRTALVVDEGQTIVLNANAGPARHDAKEKPAVYIVLTPEVVK